MSKLKQLKGVANNLSASLLNYPLNREFIYEIVHILKEIKSETMTINLLDENVGEKFETEKIQNKIKEYKKWFLNEIKRIGVEIGVIEKVEIEITFSSKIDARKYTCKATIFAKGKQYSKTSIAFQV